MKKVSGDGGLCKAKNDLDLDCPCLKFFLVSDPLCLSSSLPIILFVSTTLLTVMISIFLHMQWPLTSQSHGRLPQVTHLVNVEHVEVNSSELDDKRMPESFAGANVRLENASKLLHSFLQANK
jgi:hypothetical protein